MKPDLSCVVIEKAPYGTCSYSQSMASVDEAHTLTVRCTDEAFVNRYGVSTVLPADRWFTCTLYDDHGAELQRFISPTQDARKLATMGGDVRKAS